MRCVNYRKDIVLIVLAVALSSFAVSSFGQKIQSDKNQIKPCDLLGQGRGISGQGNGLAADYGIASTDRISEPKTKEYPAGTKPLQIVSKPRAYYTDEARNNCITGTVLIKITFFKDGRVGKFKVLKGLNYGLSEQAIAAAKKIKFEPALKNGKAITVTKKITYNFNIY